MKTKTLKVDFEGHVYNYGKLASVIEDVITIEVANADIETIQAEVERQYIRTFGSFYVNKIEDVTNYTPTFIISPRDIKTSINDRAVIRDALACYVRDQNRKGQRAKRASASDNAFDNAAHAQDLITRFEEGGK